MKSLNSKGFTLIESLVTFAIIAVAGTMFLVGFYNVYIIASEGSLIKTTTNTLYNDLISENENVIKESNEKNMTIVFANGSTHTIAMTKEFVKDSVTTKNPFDIQLHKLIPKTQAQLLPSIIQEEPVQPTECYDADFYVLNSALSVLPKSYKELTQINKEFYFDSIGSVAESVDKTMDSFIFGNAVGKYLVNSPDISQLQLENIIFENDYLEWLKGSSYEIKWFCIDGDSILSENKVKVYGFVKKIGTRSLILNYSTDNSKVAYLDFDNDGKLIGIEALEAELMNKKVKINNKEYSFDSIQQLNFVTDQSTELYFGKVV